MPRRHLPRHHTLLNGTRPGPRFLESNERHRCDRVRLMALLALRLKDWCDVLRERDLLTRPSVGWLSVRRQSRGLCDHGDQYCKHDAHRSQVSGFQYGYHPSNSSANVRKINATPQALRRGYGADCAWITAQSESVGIKPACLLAPTNEWVRRRLRSAIWKQWQRGTVRFAALRGPRSRRQNGGQPRPAVPACRLL